MEGREIKVSLNGEYIKEAGSEKIRVFEDRSRDLLLPLRVEVLQDGRAGYEGCEDTMIVKDLAGYEHYQLGLRNYGTSRMGVVRYPKKCQRILLKFDLEGIELPDGVEIESGRIKIFNHWGSRSEEVSEIRRYEVLRDWGEGRNRGSAAERGESCWRYGRYPEGEWDGCISDGVWAAMEPVARAEVRDEIFGWYEFDITELVQGWVNGERENYGVKLEYAGERGCYAFCLSEWSGSDGSLRPYLELKYRYGGKVGVYSCFEGEGETYFDNLRIEGLSERFIWANGLLLFGEKPREDACHPVFNKE
jgi:hypothetical protein